MIRLSSRSLLILIWLLSLVLIQPTQSASPPSLVPRQPTTPLTIITVTTAVDEFALNNTCSLREAVYAAVHDAAIDACAAGAVNDSISLPADTYTLTRTGALEDSGLFGDLDITGTLQLTGATSATTIINGNGTDRIFDIFSGNVTLTHLTLRNGTVELTGGAVQLRSGALTVDQTTFEHNRVKTNSDRENTYGGAIHNPAGTLTVLRSVFAANAADSSYMDYSGLGGVVYNGATSTTTFVDSVVKDTVQYYSTQTIFNTGSLTVSNSVFMHNPVPIWNNNSGIALVEATQFFTNTAPAILNAGEITINDSEIAFTDISPSGFYCSYGGALNNRGQAEIKRTFIHDNVTEYGSGVASSGSTSIRDSAIIGNRAPNLARGREDCAGEGAGIYVSSGSLHIENSTIADNWAEYTGAGIYSGYFASQTIITNTTIVSNYSDLNHPFIGHDAPPTTDAGGIYASKPITITNSLIAHNSSWLSPDASDCEGALVSANSLILAPTSSCTFTATNSLIGIEPLLGTLADHGGNTLTYNLLPGSPAIDAGALNGCPAHDQRGINRPQDGDGSNGAQCDIGAYEYVAEPEYAIYLPYLRK
ncbi:MAG: CSLREA domain-containing protein [Herpetosiphonaceae bacterium]|nr:CSLREA domain-containing protein [Herpetosiphonaceae bacterium]